MEQIHFIITGGTIDSYYDGTQDTAVPNQESIIPGFIKNLKLPIEHQFTTVCMKDSRAITDIVRSDGAFNIGFAMGQLDRLAPGVYVCMNGKILEADEAKKIVSEGRFTSRNEGVE